MADGKQVIPVCIDIIHHKIAHHTELRNRLSNLRNHIQIETGIRKSPLQKYANTFNGVDLETNVIRKFFRKDPLRCIHHFYKTEIQSDIRRQTFCQDQIHHTSNKANQVFFAVFTSYKRRNSTSSRSPAS